MPQQGDVDHLLVDVQSDVRGTLFHDRLLSYAALPPQGGNPRYSRWHRPLWSHAACTHDDSTIVSRSLHIVWFEELQARVPPGQGRGTQR